MSKPILALIPSGYKTSKVYSILPNDASGDFDFDRASVGTRVRKDGLIEEVTNDVPRLDWLNSNCPSLLLESQRTNLVTYSEDFSQWSPTNATITQNVVTSPDGSVTADKIVGTSITAQHRVNFTSTNVSGTTTFSFFAKSAEYNSCWARIGLDSAYFDLENGVTGGESSGITSSIEYYGNGWYRCIMTKASSIANEVCRINITTSYLNASDFLGDNTSGIYLWGAQHEQGDYPTSYIKTEGSIETRLKDECLNGGNSDLFDITEGTFFVDAVNFGTPLNDYSMITLSDGSNVGNFVRFIYESSRIRTSVFNGTTQQDYIITGTSDNQRNKVAITFKENEFKTYLNGVLKNTDTIGVVPTGFDRVNFSNPDGTSRNFEGKVYDTRVYDRVLTEAEAIELTT